MSDHENEEVNSEVAESQDRREFLRKAGRFAAVTPAAAAVLLSTSMDAEARAVGSMGDRYNGIKYKKARKIKKIRKIRRASYRRRR